MASQAPADPLEHFWGGHGHERHVRIAGLDVAEVDCRRQCPVGALYSPSFRSSSALPNATMPPMRQSQVFEYDIFISHSAKEKAVPWPLAERLRQAGLNRRSDFGFRIPDCGFAQPSISANPFDSGWVQSACPAEASERRRKAGTC